LFCEVLGDDEAIFLIGAEQYSDSKGLCLCLFVIVCVCLCLFFFFVSKMMKEKKFPYNFYNVRISFFKNDSFWCGSSFRKFKNLNKLEKKNQKKTKKNL